MELNFAFLTKYSHLFAKGFQATLGLAAIGVLIGAVLGTLLALMRMSRIPPLRWPAVAYIEFLRGTPLMVQVTFGFFAVPQIFGFSWTDVGIDRFAVGAVVLGLNSAAYVAEIVRSGIQSVDPGQTEAARSLGMGTTMTMTRIILPQAVKNILPALGNEFIVVIKESSIVSILGIGELMYMSQRVSAATYKYFEPLVLISIIYFIITFTLSKLLGGVERHMDRSRRTSQALARRQAAEAELLNEDPGVKKEDQA